MNNDNAELPDDEATQLERPAQTSDECIDPGLREQDIATGQSNHKGDDIPASAPAGIQMNESSSSSVNITTTVYNFHPMNISGIHSGTTLPSSLLSPSHIAARQNLRPNSEVGSSTSVNRLSQQQSAPVVYSDDVNLQLHQLARQIQNRKTQPENALPPYLISPTSGANQNIQYGGGQIPREPIHPNYSLGAHDTFNDSDFRDFVTMMNQLQSQHGGCNKSAGDGNVTSIPQNTNNQPVVTSEKTANKEKPEDYKRKVQERALFKAPASVAPWQDSPGYWNGILPQSNINNHLISMGEKQPVNRNQLHLNPQYQRLMYNPYPAYQRVPPQIPPDQFRTGGFGGPGYNRTPTGQNPYNQAAAISRNDTGKEKEPRRSGGGPIRTKKGEQTTKPKGPSKAELVLANMMVDVLRNRPGWDKGADDFDVREHGYNKDGTPKRPSNAFMLYARYRRSMIKNVIPGKAEKTSVVSYVLAKLYKERSDEMKKFHDKRAEEHRADFRARHPDYVYKKAPRKGKKKVQVDVTEEDMTEYDTDEDYEANG